MTAIYRNPYGEITLKVEDAKSLPFFDALLLNYLRFSACVTHDRGLAKGMTNITNRELCDAFGVSERYVSLSISRLRKAGRLEFVSYNGKERVLSVTT
jgi:hypothetical protein